MSYTPTTILIERVTMFLTEQLGREPTAAEILNGLSAPWSLGNVHNILNPGQSIYSVDTTDDLQGGIDELDANGGGVLFLKPGIFNLTDNLTIPSNVRIEGVGSEGSIIDFGGGAYQIRMIGTLGSEITSPALSGITVRNSSTDLIVASYVNNLLMDDVVSDTGLTGLKADNITTANINSCLQTDCETGMVVTDSTLFTVISSNTFNSTTGGGVVFTNVNNSALIACSIDGCVGGGYIFTNCSNFGLDNFAVTNITGIGLDIDGDGAGFVVAIGFIDSCSSDGVYIHGNASGVLLTASNAFTNNGGYGVNIASGSTNVLVAANNFNNNSSGAMNDAGTGTLIRSNIGAVDN